MRADPEEWSRDPWGGELVDGWVWGRGALDMKGQVAAELAACLELGRERLAPAPASCCWCSPPTRRPAATSARSWLCEQHPDKVRSDFVVNEGGGAAIELGGRRLYTLSVGEKGIFRVRLTARGRAGHASLPQGRRQRPAEAGAALARLTEQPPPEPTPEGLAFLSALLGERYEGDDAHEAGLRAAPRRAAPARGPPRRADARA